MQTGGSQRNRGSWTMAALWAVCLTLNVGCNAFSPSLASPASPDTQQGDAGTPPEPPDAGEASTGPDGGVGSEADAGLPDAGSPPVGCTQTTQRWQITENGNVYSGRAERQYDADGKLVQERTFSPTDVLQVERVYEYEPSGWLRDERSRAIDGDVSVSSHTHRTYLADGRLLTRTATHQRLSPRQRPTTSTIRDSRTYGASGQLLHDEHHETHDSYSVQLLNTYIYDTQGRLDAVETFSRGQLVLRRVATYDAQGRLERVDRFGEYAGGPDYYTYPAEGGWSVEYRAPGWLETWKYDAQGRLREMRTGHDSGSGSEFFTFDTEGRLRTHSKGERAGRYSGGEQHTHTYDAEGRRTSTETQRRWSDSHTHPVDFSDEQTRTAYTYDAAGQFRLREERVLSAVQGFEGQRWESAPPGFLLERTEATGPNCRPPPDAPPPQDTYAFPR